MNEIKVNLENLSDAEREQLMKLIDKANSPVSKVWKPKQDEEYYFIDEVGVAMTEWVNSYQDTHLYNIGNLFRSVEEAEEEIKRRKLLKRWEDLSIESGESDNPWNGECLHHCVYWDVSKKRLHYNWLSQNKYQETHFATKESLEKAVKEIGEDNVKRYILGVK